MVRSVVDSPSNLNKRVGSDIESRSPVQNEGKEQQVPFERMMLWSRTKLLSSLSKKEGQKTAFMVTMALIIFFVGKF
jgi:hypothetical protein